MQKHLLIIFVLLTFFALGLVFSANTYAKRNDVAIAYNYEPANNEADAVVYPNPAEENIFVRLDLIDPALTTDSDVEIEIRSLLGTPMPVEAERIDASKFRILTADFPSGYYLLIVQHNEGVGGLSKEVFKFLKK